MPRLEYSDLLTRNIEHTFAIFELSQASKICRKSGERQAKNEDVEEGRGVDTGMLALTETSGKGYSKALPELRK